MGATHSGIDLLVVGHFSADLMPNGSHRLGGVPAYGGMCGHRLGYRTSVLSSLPNDQLLVELPGELEIRVVPCDHMTMFENRYGPVGGRKQLLHQRAGDISRTDLPVEFSTPKMVVLGPIADEVDPDLIFSFDEDVFKVVLPQGWMRQWDPATKLVHSKPFDRWDVLEAADLVCCSEEDLAADGHLLETFRKFSPHLLVTKGREGATYYHQDKVIFEPSFSLESVDATGAGDVFAMAFAILWQEGATVSDSLRFAHAAAGLSILGTGIQAIPDRQKIRSFLKRVNP